MCNRTGSRFQILSYYRISTDNELIHATPRHIVYCKKIKKIKIKNKQKKKNTHSFDRLRYQKKLTRCSGVSLFRNFVLCMDFSQLCFVVYGYFTILCCPVQVFHDFVLSCTGVSQLCCLVRVFRNFALSCTDISAAEACNPGLPAITSVLFELGRQNTN